MKLVQIINGIYGHKPKGHNVIVPTTPKDAPILVEDTEAERIVHLGVARYLTGEHTHAHEEAENGHSGAFEAPDNIGDSPENEGAETVPESPTEDEAAIDAEGLKGMKYDELKEMAAGLGIDTGKIRKKAELIDAITSAGIAPGVEDVIE